MIRFRSHHYVLLFTVIASGAYLLWLLAHHTADGPGGKSSSSGRDENSDSAAVSLEAAAVAQPHRRAKVEAVTSASTMAIRHALPALEARFIADRQVRLDALRESLTTDRFEQDYQSLENAMVQSADALALRDIYRDAIARQVTHAGLGSGPERLACGLNLCLGSLRTAGKDDRYRVWWNDFTSSNQTPNGTTFDFPHTLDDGSIEHRFFFSTDPAANLVKSRSGP